MNRFVKKNIIPDKTIYTILWIFNSKKTFYEVNATTIISEKQNKPNYFNNKILKYSILTQNFKILALIA